MVFGLGPLELSLILIVLLPSTVEVVVAVNKAKAKGRSGALWGILVGVLGPFLGLVPLAVLLMMPGTVQAEPALRKG